MVAQDLLVKSQGEAIDMVDNLARRKRDYGSYAYVVIAVCRGD
jgi:hypothetical protein